MDYRDEREHELEELEIHEADDDLVPAEYSPQRRGDRSPLVWILSVLLALLAAAAAYYWFASRAEPEAVALPAEKSPAPVETEAVPAVDSAAIDLPPLGESDSLVRQLVGALSEHPQLLRWLASEELVRTFVVAVDNLASGETPRAHLGMLRPQEGFSTVERGGETYVDPRSYRRYDLLTEVATSVNTEGATTLYRQLKPLIDEAYRDLGYPDRDFDDTLARAIRVILEAPRVPESVALVQGVRTYDFKDPRYARLSPAQQQLMRLGPQNLGRLQAKASAFAQALAGETGAGQ